MSELLNSVTEAARPALEAEIKNLATNYLTGFEKMLSSAGSVKAVVEAHLSSAAAYRWEAMKTADESTRRAYVEGAADELAAAKTVLVSEATAIGLEQAETFLAGFEAVLSAVGSAAKAALGAIVSAAAAGAIKGLTGGGEDTDLSGIFPGI